MNIVIEEIVFNPLIQVNETVEEVIIEVAAMQMPATKESIGLGNVDNTSDLNKPISTAVALALDDKLNVVDYNDRFKGVFLTLEALNLALPTANAGDSAQVNEVGATDVINYSWDAEENIWVQSGAFGSGASNTDALPEGTSNLYFTTARVLATLINGVSFLVGTPIVSTDTILVALGKLQKQITNNNSNAIKNIVKDVVPTTPITGTTAETIFNSYLIPANTFSANDMMKIPYFEIGKVGVAAGGGIRILINTSNTLTGAVQIARYAFGVNTTYAKINRQFNINGGAMTGFSFLNNNTASDYGQNLSSYSSTPFNPAIDNYIITTGVLSIASESIQQRCFCVTN